MMKSVLLAMGVALLMPPIASIAAAQEARRTAVEFSVGSLMFPDDGTVTEGMVGGSVRLYLLPRVAIGPELLYVQGSNHSHLMLTGNVTFDFFGPTGGREPRVTPFLVIGGGMFQTRDQTPRGEFSSNEGAFTAGGGVRGAVTDRLHVGAEVRIGWELHLRVNGFVGWRF
jgi:opacity protein-like surface antigen